MTRKAFPKQVETQVLVESRRRCALCFGLSGDAREKKGQLAHVDQNPSNAAPENAAFLCIPHHDKYDSRSRHSKGITPGELKTYRQALYDHLKSQPGAWPDAVLQHSSLKGQRSGVSLEVFDRRVACYRTTREFVRRVVANGKVELEEIFKFAEDTDEALFLFDEAIAEYLSEVYRKAIRLRFIGKMLERPGDQNVGALAEEDAQLLNWFSEQFGELRKRFVLFLRLA